VFFLCLEITRIRSRLPTDQEMPAFAVRTSTSGPGSTKSRFIGFSPKPALPPSLTPGRIPGPSLGQSGLTGGETCTRVLSFLSPIHSCFFPASPWGGVGYSPFAFAGKDNGFSRGTSPRVPCWAEGCLNKNELEFCSLGLALFFLFFSFRCKRGGLSSFRGGPRSTRLFVLALFGGQILGGFLCGGPPGKAGLLVFCSPSLV